MEHVVKVKLVESFTRDVLRIVADKPAGFHFTPGQAVDVAINKDGWRNEKRPFSFICRPEDEYLEFAIKTYPSHKGVTNELLQLEKNDKLILSEIFGEIAYKGEGVFIAGGAGITPFISIFRDLQTRNEVGANKLIFANKTKADIILSGEFQQLLGDNFINILSQEKAGGCAYGLITENFLRQHLYGSPGLVYLCGPPSMMEAVEAQLKRLNIDGNSIVKEAF